MNQYSETVKRIIKLAYDEAMRLGSVFVGQQHLLLAFIKNRRDYSTSGIRILEQFGVDLNEVKKYIENSQRKSTLVRRVDLKESEDYKRSFILAGKEAEEDHTRGIYGIHLLLGMFNVKGGFVEQFFMNYGINYETLKRLKNVGKNELRQYKEESIPEGGEKFLEKFTRDLNQLAKEGKLDPVIGREDEIERVIQILARRKKNNPVLVGEPGVGKTAIVEGLAQRIVEGIVPGKIKDKVILQLDLTSLIAGTKYRGQFEGRMKVLFEALKEKENAIVFIDELHTILGAGAAEGSLDVANMIKPPLTRGEIQMIGATTYEEYRKYIEKDGALERRFQSISVEETTIEETYDILKGLQSKYEEFHNVKYTDEAVMAAVKLSARYVQNRYLPDKAIDVIDEAGARATLSFKNGLSLEDIRKMKENLEEVKRLKIDAVNNGNFLKAAEYRTKEQELMDSLSSVKSSRTVIINEDDIRSVISQWTHIPVSNISVSERYKLINLEEELKKYIVGQDRAIEAIARSLRRNYSGLRDPRRPIGSFIFMGPTGVGKTQLARVLARILFGDYDAIIRIDMSEYSEKFSVSRLIGAPPGYVGYNEGGQLTTKVRRRPYSIVLFDEIEKADLEVHSILLQILDDGAITDASGKKVSFRNTIIILTSNLGTQFLKTGMTMGFKNAQLARGDFKNKMAESLKEKFNPEFLNRFDEIVYFNQLEKESLIKIVDILFEEMIQRLNEAGINVILNDDSKEYLAEKGFDPVYGARYLRNVMEREILDPLSEMILKNDITRGNNVHILVKNGNLNFKITKSKKKEKIKTV
ncbi:ATP-dependent Clp protease ATP-binding subunit [candidate division WOR-3 bacterium]|nr:ATP-dependent Clp protease ATP-binding subunit [candidate division WOR-3 bacterium]